MRSWDDLHYFLALARAGTLTDAGTALGVSHTTVFRRVRRLEASWGTRLFDTTPEGWSLTEAGTRLHLLVEDLAHRVAHIHSGFEGLDTQVAGPVTIAVEQAVAETLLPDAIVELKATYPEIALHILVSTNTIDFSRREADIAIRFGNAPPPHLLGRPLGSCALVPMASASYVAEHGRGFPEDATKARFVLVDGQRPSWWRSLGLVTPSSNVTVTDSVRTAYALCVRGAGILQLPDFLADGQVVPLDHGPQVGPIQAWLLMHPDLKGMPRFSLTAQLLVKHLRPRLQGTSDV